MAAATGAVGWATWRRVRHRPAQPRRLRVSAERLGMLVESLDAVVWAVERGSGMFTYVNDRCEAILGYPVSWWMTRGLASFLEIIHPLDQGRLAAACRACRERGERFDITYRVVARDGRVLWLRTLAQPGRDSEWIYGVSLDVTHQHAIQEALLASEHRFRSLFDQAAVGIVEAGLDGRAILANERFCVMLGYTQHEVASKHFSELTHPDDLPSDMQHAERLTAGEIESYSLEKRFLRRDGKPVWAMLTCSAVKDSAGRMQSAVAIVQDISAQKRAEAKLHQLTATLERRVAKRTAELRRAARHLARTEQKERQRLAADLHDDLAQLLVAAQMKLASLEPEDELLPQRVDETRDLLQRALHFVRTLIVTLSPASLSGRGLDEMLRWLAGRIRDDYGLAVHVEAEEKAERADEETRVMLFHAARELLVNVAKHAQTGEAWVQLWQERGRLHLRVVDRGRGFTSDKLAERSREQGGFGLSYLRDRVRLAEGKLAVESVPGEGSEVTVSVPLLV